MKRIWAFIKNLIKSDTQESSKRFLAVYIILVLVSWIVFAYTKSTNAEIILIELLGFVAVLMGVASWQSVKNKSKDDEIPK